MYTFSNKLKIGAIILTILGAFMVGYGFITSNVSINEVEVMLKEEASHGGHGEHKAEAHSGKDHAEHVMHQIHNRPWAATYVGAFFFFMIALGVLAFYAIQWAAQAGWSPVLFRVMEGITAYVFPGAVIVFVIALLSHYVGHNSIFIWMDPELTNPENHEKYDKLVDGKSGF